MKIYIYILLLGIALLTACTSSTDDVQTSRVPIYISATVESPKTATRAPYILTTASTTNPLSAAVWMSTTPQNYSGDTRPGDDATVIGFHNTATFTGENKQLLNTPVYYPSNSVPVYFVGLHPQTGWSTTDGATATATFDGKTDVMFAPEVSNSIETSAQYPVLNFHHLLTWLRFRVYAEDQNTADAWAEVTSIAIRSNNKVNVDLATTYDAVGAIATGSIGFTDTGTGTLSAYVHEAATGANTDTEFTNQAIPLYTAPMEVGYVLAAPVDATDAADEYTLIISTRSRQDIEVPVNLTRADGTNYVGNTAGHQFLITLKFANGDNITTTVAVESWANGGSTIIPVEE